MQTFRRSIFYFIVFLSVLVILISLLTLIHDLKYWYFKIIDFPRVQYLIVALFCLVAFILINRKWNFSAIFLTVGLLFAVTIQSIKVVPYFAGTKKVPDAMSNVSNKDAVKVLIANVLIENREADKLLTIINNSDPDIVLTMEVNDWWLDQLEVLEKDYPHVMEYPTENAYGMALYSRLPVQERQIKFLNQEDIPSFHALITLPSGKNFRFHGVHPVPPVPSKKYPDNVGEEEIALLKIANMIARDSVPSLVAGDFNDVSWSNTSRLFEDTGNLNNVRIGRGLYNSYNAQSPIVRWPLDHFFVTEEFFLKNLEKLPKFGSDHFPMLAEFVIPEEAY